MRVFKPQDSDKAFACGLAWQVLDPMGDSFLGHQQIPRIIEDGGRFYVRYKNIGEVNIGVLKNFEDAQNEKEKIYSFASLVATHDDFGGRTCLVLVRDDSRDEPVGIAVGMVAGNVVIDQAFSIDEVNSVYDEFLYLCSKSGRGLFVAGDLCPIGVEISPAHRVTCAQVAFNKKAKKIKLQPLKNERYALTVLALVLIFILFGCIYEVWSWYGNKKLAEIERIKQAQNSPEYIYSQSVKLILSKQVLIPSLAGESFAQEVGRFPSELGGWKLSSISCQELDCTAKWSSDGGTYESFKTAAQPNWGKLNLGGSEKNALGDLQNLQHTFALNSPVHSLPPKSTWPTAESFALEQGVDWQKLKDYKWSATLGGAEQQGIPVNMNAATVRSHPDAIFGMPWSVEKQDWAIGKLVLPLMKNHVTMTNFELVFDQKNGSALFSAKGIAYVNN